MSGKNDMNKRSERSEKLLKAIGDADDELISGADVGNKNSNGTHKKIKITALIAAVLTAAILLAVFVIPGKEKTAPVPVENASGTATDDPVGKDGGAVGGSDGENNYPTGDASGGEIGGPVGKNGGSDGENNYPTGDASGGDDTQPSVYEDQPVSQTEPVSLTKAVYPPRTQYPEDGSGSAYIDWSNENLRSLLSDSHRALLTDYYNKTSELLLGNSLGENKSYSPLNTYIALSMLAETTGGDTRSQILALLGFDSVDALRENISEIWNASYKDSGVNACIPANSLWLDNSVSYNEDTLNILKEIYFASAFSGEMGSQNYTKIFRDWLNEQTKGLLEDKVSGLGLDEGSLLTLASTIYFKAKWENEFVKEATAPDTFHSPGGDVTAEFMHASDFGTYYRGEHFGAIYRRFRSGGGMWLILPDEGCTADQLIRDGDYSALFTCEYSVKSTWTDKKYLMINESVPKFDITTDIDLSESLPSLGITDVLDPGKADFSPVLNGTEGVFLSKVKHDVRVKIDEEGVEAAAFTVMPLVGSAMPDDEIDFVLDRPFVYVITSTDALPLFAGVVNQP